MTLDCMQLTTRENFFTATSTVVQQDSKICLFTGPVLVPYEFVLRLQESLSAG